MVRKLLAVLLIISLVSLTGCLTKPLAMAETAVTDLIHPDGVTYSFFGYGPWSDEFSRSVDHMDGHYNSYLGDLTEAIDDADKHFLNYDRYDPFSP